MKQPTCNKECFLWKKYKTKCPNYMTTSWRNYETGEVYSVEDCAPKRQLILQLDILNRLIGLQKELNADRSTMEQMTQSMLGVMDTISRNPNASLEVALIGDSNTQ